MATKTQNSPVHTFFHPNERQIKNNGHRLARNNVYWQGNTIYSYGGHFPIATKYVKKDGEKILFFTTRTYSKTTAKHIRQVKWAALLDYTIVYVKEPVCADRNKLNREDITGMKVELFRSFKDFEATKPAKFANYKSELKWLRGLYSCYFRYRQFCKKLGYKYKDEYETYIERHEELSKRSLKTQDNKKERAEQLARLSFEEKLPLWLSNQIATNALPHISKIYLRLRKDGQTVETSRGVTFPLQDALRAYKLLCLAKTKKMPLGQEKIMLGQFAISRFNEETGEITAGCHVLEWAEVERFYNSLQSTAV